MGADVSAVSTAARPPATLHASATAIASTAYRSSDGQPTLDRTDIASWLDRLVPQALATYDIPGATVAIVKDGQIQLVRGYGYADVAKRIKVDPEHHLFRVASISKLFTWTAVMQQVELGRLDLDTDVNRYLDFPVPPYRGKPVTLRELMTHTAGFELVMRDLFSARPNGTDLGAALKRWVPHRIHDAGSTPTYSNYGAALGGYIVQRVSGEPFDAYIDRHILQPLGMAHSSMRQPLPPTLSDALAHGYITTYGVPEPFEYTLFHPAGAMSSTASDIARFMIAHLNDGALGSARILHPETARMMHATASRALPPLHGMALGFYEHDVNGHRVLAHDGDTRFFHSQLNLFIDDRVGLFVSLNGTGRDGGADILRAALFEQFADRYFPATPTDSSVAPEIALRHARAMVGTYESSERSASNFLAFNGLDDQIEIKTDARGGLIVPAITGYDGAPKHWREIARFVWRDVNGKERLAARIVDGRPDRFSTDDLAPLVVWDRTPWWRSAGWLRLLAHCAYWVLLITLIAWPLVALGRRYGLWTLAAPPARPWVTACRYGSILIGVLAPSLWHQIIAPVMTFTADDDTMSLQIVLASSLTLLGYGGGLVLALWSISRGWTQRHWILRLSNLVLALSVGVLLWVAAAFRLLSFSTHF